MSPVASKSSQASTPAWEVATLFPSQGEWSDDDYLRLTDHTRRLVEYTDGVVEVLPMPKLSHQKIVHFLANLLLTMQAGTVVFAPFRVRIRQGKFREPDVAFLLNFNASRVQEDYWEAADLVIEVVSADNRERDYQQKRTDYAEAGIPEYWIVDPEDQKVSVFNLVGQSSYAAARTFPAGTQVTSSIVPNLRVAVDSIFKAGAIQ